MTDAIYDLGKRPEWAKASKSHFIELREQLQFAVYVIYIETRNFEKEPTLADLHQKALFLPRSTLDQLEDIGHG